MAKREQRGNREAKKPKKAKPKPKPAPGASPFASTERPKGGATTSGKKK